MVFLSREWYSQQFDNLPSGIPVTYCTFNFSRFSVDSFIPVKMESKTDSTLCV